MTIFLPERHWVQIVLNHTSILELVLADVFLEALYYSVSRVSIFWFSGLVGEFCVFLRFRRPLSSREMAESSFLTLVEGFIFMHWRQDIRVWSPNPLEGFSCKSFFSFIGPRSCL